MFRRKLFRRAACAACRDGRDRPECRRRSRSKGYSGSTCGGNENSSRTASGLNMQIHSVSRPSDVAASIMWSVTIEASMSPIILSSYLRVHASEVSAQTMTASGAPKSRVQRARRSIPSFDCTTTSRWGCRLAPVGATRPASRIRASFSGSTCLSKYLRQAYRFFASFRKSNVSIADKFIFTPDARIGSRIPELSRALKPASYAGKDTKKSCRCARDRPVLAVPADRMAEKNHWHTVC